MAELKPLNYIAPEPDRQNDHEKCPENLYCLGIQRGCYSSCSKYRNLIWWTLLKSPPKKEVRSKLPHSTEDGNYSCEYSDASAVHVFEAQLYCDNIHGSDTHASFC